jgi:hypothetical protein
MHVSTLLGKTIAGFPGGGVAGGTAVRPGRCGGRTDGSGRLGVPVCTKAEGRR